MADEKISELPPLTGAVATADTLPVVDASASETKQITAKHLLESSFNLVADGSIPSSKVSGNVTIPANSIGTTELKDKSVTAAKLADNSSGVYGSLPASGAYVGQAAVDNSTKKAYIWSGSAWEEPLGVTSLQVTDGSPVVATGQIVANELQLAIGLGQTTSAREFVAGPTNAAGNITIRPIVGADLPAATSASLGAVSVGTGLSVDGAGSLSISNAVASTTDLHLVSYDAQGLVTSGRKILGTDVPVATDLNPGVVSPGRGLSVGANGALDITNQITPGTGTKFACDAQGNITDILVLSETDIPNISADKIQGGELNPAVFADRSIGEKKLADYSTCLIQEGIPSDDYHLGQMWYTPSTSQLRVYGRGSGNRDLWLSVGFGALQAQNLRWGGTINADSATIVSLTDIGVSAGLTAGGPIPTPTDELSGLYFVVAVAGDSINIPNVSGLSFTEADWLLYIDQAQGAIRLDISAGGGGGGGASQLGDLTDVTLSNVEDGSILVYDAIQGVWENKTEIDGGTY